MLTACVFTKGTISRWSRDSTNFGLYLIIDEAGILAAN